MLNTKQRAQLRALANPLAVTLIIGKEGVTEAVERELDALLESHELVKGKVLESAMLTPRTVSRRSARRPARMPYSASARSSLSTVSRAMRTSAGSFL